MANYYSNSEPDQSPCLPCIHKVHGGKYFNSKRLIVCCDGTWSNSNEIGGYQTNVSRMSGAIAHKCCTGRLQVVHYHPGPGTERPRSARFLGGFFGTGVLQDIIECYRFICDNYCPGDEIFLIGFSRGAFTARAVADMVCKLGILSRVGLQKLPEIFHDYRTWENWNNSSKHDEKMILAAFTPEILKRQRILRHTWHGGGDMDELRKQVAEQVAADKEKLFQVLSEKTTQASDKAKAYRTLLCEYGMALKVADEDGRWTPVEGRVRAVGVWDTVGSLGMPRMPFFHYQSSRSDNEVRFASCEVDPNIDYAFHALALDEWRTAFGPTLWYLGNGNNHTQLKQVWFPGSHRNIGGGWPDQQIATIAFAWLADQLTSLGVEFSKPEMKRIFYWTNPDINLREWGQGKICNPKGLTTWPDKVYESIPFMSLPPRKPGMYTKDGVDERTLDHSKEFIHPSVRIRYQCAGKGLDDVGTWRCSALAENGYAMQQKQGPNMRRKCQENCATARTKSLLGELIPYYEGSENHEGSENRDVHSAVPYVRTHHPNISELEDMHKHNGYWSWQTADNQNELLEESVGIWERMFIRINGELVQQHMSNQAEVKQHTDFKDWLVENGILTWLEGDQTPNPMVPASLIGKDS